MTLSNRSVCLYVDGAQNPFQLERGIARYVSEHARAIHALAPSLLHSALLNPGLSLTGNLSSFLGTGLLSWGTESQAAGRPSIGDPRVYHIMSPFELGTPIDVLWPQWARNPRIATVVTLYDLIPLVFADHYLQHPVMRAVYTARLELIRHVDRILALSQNTAGDAIERLAVPPERVQVIHAGTSEHFAGMYSSPAAAWTQLSRHLKVVRPGFMLYVGGADFRKNMEGMIAGFGRLPPELRAQHQLVIVCNLNPGQHESLRGEAERAGVSPRELVLTGHVSDADLGALYRACTLFVFPSFYEGFGLPILEAMSCGAPVAASATTTAPEVLGNLEGTFDPHDPTSIAACLADIVSSPETLDRLTARSRRRVAQYTWKRVAEQSIEAYEQAVADTLRWRSRRPRIALVTPWPPEQSGIADYNLRLAAELGQRIAVDIIVGRPVEQYAAPLEKGVRLIHDRDFERLPGLLHHDRVLYCMGNSPFHGYIYELLKRRPGAVVLHDVQLLTGFYGWYAGVERPEDPQRALADRVHAMYGERLPPDALQAGGAALNRPAALGIYMTRELQSYAEQCFVHSRFARDVLELDRGPLDRQVPVSVLPFGMPHAAEAPRGFATSSPLVITLGFVHEVKGIAGLIDAFGLLAAEIPTARLMIAGPFIDPAESERWHRYARDHAPDVNIEIPGEVSKERYAELLRTADLAVQLRLVSNGEASAAVADCLAAGVPTIVTDLGWTSELPSSVVEKVPPTVGPHQLKDRMRTLLSYASKRAVMSRLALEHARDCSFSRVADAYLDALRLR
jgi:glycosyltransferase involved in cell wall biosynthesis